MLTSIRLKDLQLSKPLDVGSASELTNKIHVSQRHPKIEVLDVYHYVYPCTIGNSSYVIMHDVGYDMYAVF